MFNKKTTFSNHSGFKIKKSLRYKILLVVMPLFLISSIFLGLTAYFSLNNGITGVTKEFIGYRLRELVEFSESQIQSNSTNYNFLRNCIQKGLTNRL